QGKALKKQFSPALTLPRRGGRGQPGKDRETRRPGDKETGITVTGRVCRRAILLVSLSPGLLVSWSGYGRRRSRQAVPGEVARLHLLGREREVDRGQAVVELLGA